MAMSPLLGIKHATEEWQIFNVDRLEKEINCLQLRKLQRPTSHDFHFFFLLLMLRKSKLVTHLNQ